MKRHFEFEIAPVYLVISLMYLKMNGWQAFKM